MKFSSLHSSDLQYAKFNILNLSLIGRVHYNELTTLFNTDAATGMAISTTNRWFLNGTSTGNIESVSIRFKTINASAKLEFWKLYDGNLIKVHEETITSYKAYDLNTFPINYYAGSSTIYTSIIAAESNTVNHITNAESGFNAYRTTDLTSDTLVFSDLLTFNGLNVTGYVKYNKLYKDYDNIITVGKDYPEYSFNTITEAVQSAKDNDIILVYPGVYRENIHGFNKTFHLVGVDKYSCIIECHTSDYNNPCLEIDSGSVSNLTLRSIFSSEYATCQPSDTSRYAMDYTIHIDHYNATGKTLFIDNCIIYNDHRAAIGCGLYDHNTVTIKNCTITAGKPDGYLNNTNIEYNRRGAMYFHVRSASQFFSNVTEQKLIFMNNKVYCSDKVALFMGRSNESEIESNGWVNEAEVEFINNTFSAIRNGEISVSCDGISKAPEFTNDSIITGDDFSSHFKLAKTSHGNNLDYLNY